MGFLDTIKESLCNVTDFIKEHDTQILTGTGIVAGLGAIGGAIWATTKMGDVVDNLEAELEKLETQMDQIADNDEIDEEEYEELKKEITKKKVVTYAKFIGTTALYYSPTVILEGYSIFSRIKVEDIWDGKYEKLEAAAVALGTTFANYRKNVVDNFGEETDEAMLLGYKKELVEKTVVDENGKKKKVKEEQWVVPEDIDLEEIQKNGLSRLWNKSTAFGTYSNDPECNRFYLEGILDACNRELKRRGYLYLNDVLKKLEMEYEDCGQDLGWVYDPDGIIKGTHIHNEIDFGLDNLINKRAWDVRDPENDALLTFNIDGAIRPMLKQMNMAADYNGRAIAAIA